MRLLIAGLMHESNTFASTPADHRRFAEGSFAVGPDVIPIWKDAYHEFGGFIEGASRFGYEAVPSVMAWATPSGPVDDSVLDEVVDRIVTDFRRAPTDGILLALHGAMVTAKHPSADTEVLRRVRAEIGPSVPLIASLDFHANCDPRMADYANALVGYQTYPHIDQRQRGLLAAKLLVRAVRGEVEPVTHIAKRPMIANILGQATDREPMKGLMAAARVKEQEPGVLSTSVMGGFYYADVPSMGPSVIAVADRDRELARTTAEQLADRMWEVRHELYVPCALPHEAVKWAKDAPRGPVVLVDLGDNVGGGSAGDGTVLLAEMLKQDVASGVVVFFAPESVKECQRLGTGSRFAGDVGGAVDRLHGNPVAVAGTITGLFHGTWVEAEARHGGRRHNDQGPTAVVKLDGGITLVLNSLQTPPFSLGQLTSLNIDVHAAQMIVVKAAVAYKAAYAPIAAEIIEVDTPGVTAVNPSRFTYRNIPRPMFPLDG
ncbi:MAG TPA: M81 family metallopeptidase [Gemmataceae bacterium]|jgi:microcystin degradation protein MlrC|nr:M81 family metallopeptidase [Gemmataceae bacterium]